MSTDRTVVVQSCRIHVRHAGQPGRPRVVLVHGGRAHGGWWARVAPNLAKHYEVLVPDLSGFGRSGRRTHYAPEIWADEIAALISHDGGSEGAVVGHSMGGWVSIYAAARYPDVVRALVLVDTALWPTPPATSTPRTPPRRLRRFYPSQAAALANFRLSPPDTAADPTLLHDVAMEALVDEGGQWTWAFDPNARKRISEEGVLRHLDVVQCPVGMVRGERSTMVNEATVDLVRSRLGRPVPAVTVPGAFHHVPLDAPDDCAAAVLHLLASLTPEWSH